MFGGSRLGVSVQRDDSSAAVLIKLCTGNTSERSQGNVERVIYALTCQALRQEVLIVAATTINTSMFLHRKRETFDYTVSALQQYAALSGTKYHENTEAR